MMVKKDPIKIREEKKFEKKADQENSMVIDKHVNRRRSIGVSTALNKEETWLRFLTGSRCCRQACRQPGAIIEFKFLFRARSSFFPSGL